MPSIQAKIVGDFCNLRCTYCRDRDFNRGDKRVMSQQVLQALINSLAQLPQEFQRMHWMGGEPTLAGIDFFEEAIRLQQAKTHKRWLNTIQTNATFINTYWARFFYENRFKVGVSVDGTSQVHDINRVNLVGLGSYSKVMSGVRILREFGIQPSVICVVTKRNVEMGTQILRGLVDSGFTNIAFNVFYNTATEQSEDPFAVSNDAWTQFLKDIFEEWIMLDRPDVRIREIDEMLAWTQGRTARSCVFRGTCSSWMLVNYDGKVFPCERLGRAVCFGSVVSVASFAEIIKAPTYQTFNTQILCKPSKCQTCSMQSFCHNGCVAHRNDDGNSLPHYAYCDSRLSFNTYLHKRIGVMSGTATLIASASGIPDNNAVPTF